MEGREEGWEEGRLLRAKSEGHERKGRFYVPIFLQKIQEYNSNSRKLVFVKCRVTGCMHVTMVMQLWDLR